MLSSGAEVAARVSYYNADGSVGELCGNATLCSASWCVSHGYAPSAGFLLETDAGRVAARHMAQPSVRLAPVADLRADWAPSREDPAEARLGFARVGVPHVVVLVDDVDGIDVGGRGAELRRDPRLGSAGANANFVSPAAGEAGVRFRMRTFERGVEAETLACGTGAAATAALLSAWGMTSGPVVQLETRSGRWLEVELDGTSGPSGIVPVLTGEGRVVFEGRIGDLGD
ncbi:MAG: hypothetical protein MUF53_11185 [Gemmatimonadaceae bacterium]|nr:hypothetical protein [Gemmatimonadaceae bacterium]